jgi:uncharacterized RDD family membrane protein YckC
MNESPLEYLGFWSRVLATLVDCILSGILIYPLLHLVYGPMYWSSTALVKGPMDFIISFVLPAIAIVMFWVAKQATPGKMLIRAKIVDAKTGGKPTTRQMVIRYLGYYLAMIPFFVGFLLVAFDPRKQGLHDKLAGTLVVRRKE